MALNTTWATYPYPTDITGYSNLLTYFNTVTGGLFASLLLFGIWMVLFISMIRWGESKAFMASSFLGLLISGFFRAMDAIPDFVILIFIFMTAVGALVVWLRND